MIPPGLPKDGVSPEKFKFSSGSRTHLGQKGGLPFILMTSPKATTAEDTKSISLSWFLR